MTRLDGGLAEVRAAEGVGALDRADERAVQQVQDLDLHLGGFRASEPDSSSRQRRR